jgi:hypothetical protein
MMMPTMQQLKAWKTARQEKRLKNSLNFNKA